MDETPRPAGTPWQRDDWAPTDALDARTNTERLEAALTRIERVLQEFDARLAWK